jgi:hypothetical protein
MGGQPPMYPQPPQHPPQPQPGMGGAAPGRPKRKGGMNTAELVLDKIIDFMLIFVGLYAATALQRCQDTAKDKQEYVALLQDFKRELQVNLEQEESIEKDLGAITETEPGSNLGPMQATFTHFFEELGKDEKVVHCLHEEFVAVDDPSKAHVPAECHELYKQFDKAHAKEADSFSFKPAALTPFYRYEVWELYLADGIKTFRNKDLAVRIAEVYANARLIEEHVADIEDTYNDQFMTQVGRTSATDMELAEIVHDEEVQHGLSKTDLEMLMHVDEQIKDEHYQALEQEHVLELKVERMKKIVLLLREEIAAVQTQIDEELARVGE